MPRDNTPTCDICGRELDPTELKGDFMQIIEETLDGAIYRRIICDDCVAYAEGAVNDP